MRRFVKAFISTVISLSFLFCFFIQPILGSTTAYPASDVLGQFSFNTNTYNNLNANTEGFNYPTYLSLDSTNHRLFVSERDNSRISIHNLSSSNVFVDDTNDYVLGQSDAYGGICNQGVTPTATTLCNPTGSALDTTSHIFYVADYGNNRVLGYDLTSANIPIDKSADYVFGQANFTGYYNNRGASDPSINSLNNPYAVAVDPVGHHLFVADAANNRVLEFNLNSSNIPVDFDADYVFGQSNFISGSLGTSSTKFKQPRALTIDPTNHVLYVSDFFNSRVLGFDLNSSNIPTDTTADYVFGHDGDFDAGSENDGGSISNKTLYYPTALTLDTVGHHLFITDTINHRVLEFNLDSSNKPSNTDADYVFGQNGDFTTALCSSIPNSANRLCYPEGVAIDSTNHKLFISDPNDLRVLEFSLNSSNVPTDTTADYVLGENGSFTDIMYNDLTNPNALGFNTPTGIALDVTYHKLFVADRYNNRILVYNLDTNNNLIDKTADYVVGQHDFLSYDNSDPTFNISDPFGVAVDSTNHRLFVSDKGNNRVLIFNLTSTNAPDGTGPDYVFGQTDLSTTTAGSGSTGINKPYLIALDAVDHRLFVTDQANNRVIVFNLDSTNMPLDKTIDFAIGQPNLNNGSKTCNQGGGADKNTLCYPRGVAYNPVTKQLFVSDAGNGGGGNHRVMVFDATVGTLATNMNASHVLGQPDFETRDCTTSRDQICYPLGLAVNTKTNVLYVNEEYNHRTLAFNTNPSTMQDGENALGVIGQVDFDTSDNCEVGKYSFCYPGGVAIDENNNRLYVANMDDNRVMIFNLVKVTSSTLISGTQGNAYSKQISKTGSQGTVTYSLVSGALPSGLSLKSNGTVSGTPTETGTFSFKVKAQDAISTIGTFSYVKTLALTIGDGITGSSYSISTDTNSPTTPNEDTEETPSPTTSEPEESNTDGLFSVTVQVQEDGKPVANAQVKLLDMNGTTDKDGKAVFSNVKPGNYTITWSSNGKSGTVTANVVGDKTVNVDTTKAKAQDFPVVWIVLVILGIGGLVFFLKKKGESKSHK